MEHDPLSVSRETKDRLQDYASLLLRWNQRINLVSRHDEDALWNRHIEDALQLVPLMPADVKQAIDIGSGAGFPGLVLAMATGCHFVLIESDSRKCAFLREAVRATGTNATVVNARCESTTLEPVRLVTARAVAALARQITLSHPLLQADGICIFPKGKSWQTELTEAEAQWHMRVDRRPSRTDPAAAILVLSEIRRVGVEC